MVLVDLRYYAKRKRLIVPVNGVKEQVIEVILAEQVKELNERARLARGEVEEGTDGGASRPYVSTYSSGGGRGHVGVIGTEGTPEQASRGDVTGASVGCGAGATPTSTSPLSSANNNRKRLRDVSLFVHVGCLYITCGVCLYMWAVCTLHVGCLYMWAVYTLHVGCLYMWAMCTCGLSVHVGCLYMWAVCTCESG